MEYYRAAVKWSSVDRFAVTKRLDTTGLTRTTQPLRCYHSNWKNKQTPIARRLIWSGRFELNESHKALLDRMWPEQLCIAGRPKWAVRFEFFFLREYISWKNS